MCLIVLIFLLVRDMGNTRPALFDIDIPFFFGLGSRGWMFSSVDPSSSSDSAIFSSSAWIASSLGSETADSYPIDATLALPPSGARLLPAFLVTDSDEPCLICFYSSAGTSPGLNTPS